MKSHPGRTMTIYDISGVVAEAFLKATTPTNIIASFKLIGIWPFNRDTFGEEEFAPSLVTNKPFTPQGANRDDEPIQENGYSEDLAILGPSSRSDAALHLDISDPSSRLDAAPYSAVPDPSSKIDVAPHLAIPDPTDPSSSLDVEDELNSFSVLQNIRPLPKAIGVTKKVTKRRKKKTKRCSHRHSRETTARRRTDFKETKIKFSEKKHRLR